jgi:hypothetical protein
MKKKYPNNVDLIYSSELKDMKTIFIYAIVISIFIVPNVTIPQSNVKPLSDQTNDSFDSVNEIPIALQCLLKAYPEYIDSATANTLIWKDGTEMIFDDGIKEKDHQTLLNHPDLEDQLSMPYPLGQNYPIPLPKNFEPGRVRYEPFFLKMYGKSIKEIQEKLVPIIWLPRTVNKRLMITSVNNVNEKLQAVSNELDELPDSLKKYVINTSGTVNWRKISGTERLSVHSFGIAIDIDVKHANYWKWDNPDPEDDQCYKNHIPIEIVEIFEKHGFIWGGKWYHYDTMHFEYRPELLQKKKKRRRTAKRKSIREKK